MGEPDRGGGELRMLLTRATSPDSQISSKTKDQGASQVFLNSNGHYFLLFSWVACLECRLDILLIDSMRSKIHICRSIKYDNNIQNFLLNFSMMRLCPRHCVPRSPELLEWRKSFPKPR